MEKVLRFFSVFDWFLGAILVMLGIYQSNPWLTISGSIAFLTAYYRPAEKINDFIKAKLVAKRVKPNDADSIMAEDTFYEHLVEDDSSKKNANTIMPSTYANRVKAYGNVTVSTRKYIPFKNSM